MYLLDADGSLLLRMLIALPGHMVDAIFMGHYLTKALKENDTQLKKKYMRLSLVIPFLLHGVYDSACTLLQYDYFGDLLWILAFLVILVIFIKFYIIASVKKFKESVKANELIAPEPAAVDTAFTGMAAAETFQEQPQENNISSFYNN
jgi:RsiW-degrading membrane proteinase PrsW (M82 family)